MRFVVLWLGKAGGFLFVADRHDPFLIVKVRQALQVTS